MTLSTLYKKNKNESIQVWAIWTEGADIVTEHGKLDGKKQLSRKTAKAKNVGRANETSASEQAILTAKSMWTKKKDKGYFESREEAETNLVFLPMLLIFSVHPLGSYKLHNHLRISPNRLTVTVR